MDQKNDEMDQKMDQMEARVLEAFHKAETLVKEIKYLEQPVKEMKKSIAGIKSVGGNDEMTDEWEWDINGVGKRVKRYMTKGELAMKHQQELELAEGESPSFEQDIDEDEYFAWLAGFDQDAYNAWVGGQTDERFLRDEDEGKREDNDG
jgi:hypothetical protein